MRSIIYIAIGIVTLSLGTIALGFEGEIYQSFAKFAQLGGVIAIFAGAVAFFTGLGKGRSSSGASDNEGWVSKRFGRNKKGTEPSSPEAQAAAKDQGRANIAELRVLIQLRKLFNIMGKGLDKLLNGKNIEKNLTEIEIAKEEIIPLIRQLNRLEKKEIEEENLKQKLAEHKIPGKYHNLISDERNLVIRLNNLIQNIAKHVDKNNTADPNRFRNAKNDVNFALQIVTLLERINAKELKH